MGKIINVPQGRGARLTRTTLAYGIDGLYTEGFSSCVIIVAIGKDKIALSHVDLATNSDAVVEEIKKTGEPTEIDVLIIYRENYSTFFSKEFSKYLQERLPAYKIMPALMDDKHNGILVSFDPSQSSTIHPQIQKFQPSHLPNDLLRHPDEQLFEAVQKIEQIIGLRSKANTKAILRKNLIIFDGRCWETIDAKEKSIHCPDTITKKEIDFFSPTDNYLVIAGKLGGIVKSLEGIIPLADSVHNLAMPIAVQFEGYLNNFDSLLLLKRSLIQALDKDDQNSIFQYEKPVTNEDQITCDRLNTELSRSDCSPDRIDSIMAEYKKNSSVTSFKTQLMGEYVTFKQHYQTRRMYAALKQDYHAKFERAKRFSNEGVKLTQQQKYDAAANLFFEALKLLTQFCLKDAPELALAYWNFGRTLQRKGELHGAKNILNTALLLHQYYLHSPTEKIEKIQTSIKECEQGLEFQSQNNEKVAVELKN